MASLDTGITKHEVCCTNKGCYPNCGKPLTDTKQTCGALQRHGAHWWTEGDHTVSCPGNLK